MGGKASCQRCNHVSEGQPVLHSPSRYQEHMLRIRIAHEGASGPLSDSGIETRMSYCIDLLLVRRATVDLPHDFARSLLEGFQPPTNPMLSTGRSSYQQYNGVKQVGTQSFYGIKFITQSPASHICLHCFRLVPWSGYSNHSIFKRL